MVKGFAHCALYVPELEKTAQFYMDVFGAKNLGYFQASARGCWLQIGEDILEIFQSEKLGDGCFKHIALTCEDVDAIYDRAIAFGGAPLVAPKEAVLELNQPVSVRLAFVTGINGEQIELFCIHGD